NHTEQSRALVSGELDIGLFGMAYEAKRQKLPHEPVLKYQVLVALPKAHSSARREKVSLAALASEVFVGISEKSFPGAWEMAVKVCVEAGFRPKYLQTTNDAFATLGLVSTGCAVAFMPESMKLLVPDNVVFRPFDPPLVLDGYVVWKRGAPTGAMKEFL